MYAEDILFKIGTKLFKFRSYSPLLLIPLTLFERKHISYPWGDHAGDLIWEFTCFFVAILGLALRIIVIGGICPGTSGRNTKSQRASTLNTTGMYSIVRNPLYLANYIILIGITMLVQSWQLLVINTVLFFLVHILIILVEEHFLRDQFGCVYADYISQVPRMIPNIRLFKPSDRKWSLKMVLKRENDTFFMIVLVFSVMDIFRDYVVLGKFHLDAIWSIALVVSVINWLVLKFIKKYTRLLRPSGSSSLSGANSFSVEKDLASSLKQ